MTGIAMTIKEGSGLPELTPSTLSQFQWNGGLRDPCINCQHLIGLLEASKAKFYVGGNLEY